VVVRSVFALLAAAFFLLNGLTFLAPGAEVVALETDANGRVVTSEIGGEPAAVAVTSAARMLAGGLVILSLAVVDWAALALLFGTTEGATTGSEPNLPDH
jgi:hypothetical protein